jgi:hypothetical protein
MATLFRLLVAPSSFTYTPFRVITPSPHCTGWTRWHISPWDGLHHQSQQILFTAPVYNLNTPAPRAKYVNTNA